MGPEERIRKHAQRYNQVIKRLVERERKRGRAVERAEAGRTGEAEAFE
jgi:hypothetical protein